MFFWWGGGGLHKEGRRGGGGGGDLRRNAVEDQERNTHTRTEGVFRVTWEGDPVIRSVSRKAVRHGR